MDFRPLGFFDSSVLSALQDMMDIADESPAGGSTANKQTNAPSRAYVRDAKAMARTLADVKELPNSYEFVVDMPGVTPAEVKVQLEDEDGVLVVSGERKRDRPEEDKDKEGVKYLRMERRMGKFMRKFPLPENAKREAITAAYKDGVLTVTVEKVPPPQPKKPKVIRVMGA